MRVVYEFQNNLNQTQMSSLRDFKIDFACFLPKCCPYGTLRLILLVFYPNVVPMGL